MLLFLSCNRFRKLLKRFLMLVSQSEINPVKSTVESLISYTLLEAVAVVVPKSLTLLRSALLSIYIKRRKQQLQMQEDHEVWRPFWLVIHWPLFHEGKFERNLIVRAGSRLSIFEGAWLLQMWGRWWKIVFLASILKVLNTWEQMGLIIWKW